MLHKRLSMFSSVTNYFPRCVHGKQCHPCRSRPVGVSRVVFTGNCVTRAARGRWEVSRVVFTGNCATRAARDRWEVSRVVFTGNCATRAARDRWEVSRVVFTGNCATRAARDLCEASRVVNTRVTTKTPNPSISSPSWNLWRESSWFIVAQYLYLQYQINVRHDCLAEDCVDCRIPMFSLYRVRSRILDHSWATQSLADFRVDSRNT